MLFIPDKRWQIRQLVTPPVILSVAMRLARERIGDRLRSRSSLKTRGLRWTMRLMIERADAPCRSTKSSGQFRAPCCQKLSIAKYDYYLIIINAVQMAALTGAINATIAW